MRKGRSRRARRERWRARWRRSRRRGRACASWSPRFDAASHRCTPAAAADPVQDVEQSTGIFLGPFADIGRIAELDAAEEDGIPLPPTAGIALAGSKAAAAPTSDDHIEIDIEELGLAPPRTSSGRIAR